MSDPGADVLSTSTWSEQERGHFGVWGGAPLTGKWGRVLRKGSNRKGTETRRTGKRGRRDDVSFSGSVGGSGLGGSEVFGSGFDPRLLLAQDT